MMFKFLHADKSCSAYAVYDCSRSTNLLIVYNLDFNEELGYKIIFYPNEERRWGTSHDIKTKFPDTYNSLCENISYTFGRTQFRFVE